MITRDYSISDVELERWQSNKKKAAYIVERLITKQFSHRHHIRVECDEDRKLTRYIQTQSDDNLVEGINEEDSFSLALLTAPLPEKVAAPVGSVDEDDFDDEGAEDPLKHVKKAPKAEKKSVKQIEVSEVIGDDDAADAEKSDKADAKKAKASK